MTNHPNRGGRRSYRMPTPDDIKAVREQYGLSMAEAARLVFVSESKWKAWETGERDIMPGLWTLFTWSVSGAPDGAIYVKADDVLALVVLGIAHIHGNNRALPPLHYDLLARMGARMDEFFRKEA